MLHLLDICNKAPFYFPVQDTAWLLERLPGGLAPGHAHIHMSFFLRAQLQQSSNFPTVACTHTYTHTTHTIHSDPVTQLYVWMPYIRCLLIFVHVDISLFSSLMLKPGLALVNWFVEDIQRRWVWRKCVKRQRHLCDWCVWLSWTALLSIFNGKCLCSTDHQGRVSTAGGRQPETQNFVSVDVLHFSVIFLHLLVVALHLFLDVLHQFMVILHLRLCCYCLEFHLFIIIRARAGIPAKPSCVPWDYYFYFS